MRAFLLNTAPVIVWIVIALELLVFLGLLFTFVRTKKTVAFLSMILTLGLLFDAVVIGIGNFLPLTSLKTLSQYRFILHGFMVPILLLISAHTLEWKGGALALAYMVTFVLMMAGLYMGKATVLEPVEFAGLRRFVSGSSTPALAKVIERVLSFGTVLPLILAGIVAFIEKKQGLFIFLGGLAMFIFSALAPATGNIDLIFLISMFGELLMVFCFYLYCNTKK